MLASLLVDNSTHATDYIAAKEIMNTMMKR